MARDDRDDRRRAMRDRVRERAEENKFSGGSSYIQLPEGKSFYKLTKSTRQAPTILDVLPYEVQQDGTYHDGKNKEITLRKGDLWWCRTILVHRSIGVAEKSYICPRTIGKPCPLCEYRAALNKSPDGDKKLADALKPQAKDIMNIYVSKKEGIQLLEHSHANFREKLEKELREGREEWYDFALLEGGYTLEVVFSEEKYQGSTYLEAGRIDFVQRDDFKESILDEVIDLDACLIVLPYDKLEEIAFGDGSDSRDSDRGRDDDRGRGSRDDDNRGRERDRGEERSSSRERGNRDKDDERDTGRGRERNRDDDDRERGSKDDPPPSRERTRTKPDGDKKNDGEGGGRERSRSNAKDDDAGSSRSRSRTDTKDDDKKGNGDCPDGGTFGKDCNERKFCTECEVWEKCADEFDRLKKR